MAEGLRGMRGPFYNADDYPSLLMLLITTAWQAQNRTSGEKQTATASVTSVLFQLQWKG